MERDKREKFDSCDETSSIQVETPSLVETPDIQFTTIERSTLEQTSSRVSFGVSSISVETPSLNVQESITSASEMLSTPAAIDQLCPRSGQSPAAPLSILSFKSTNLRPLPPDDSRFSVSGSTALVPDPFLTSGSDSRTSRSSLLPHESISVNTIAEENSKSTQSLVSLGEVLEGPTNSQPLDDDHFQTYPFLDTEHQMLANKIEALESELLLARSEADELMLQLEIERHKFELVSQCLRQTLTIEQALSPMVPSPSHVMGPPTTYVDADVQTTDTSETMVELNKQEYESFMVIALKLQDENNALWEQVSSKDKTIALTTEAVDTLTDDVKHLTDQLSIIGDTNLSLQIALQEKTSIIEQYELERAQLALTDNCQQTDSPGCVSKEVYTDEPVELPFSTDVEQQTSRIPTRSPSLSGAEHSIHDEHKDTPGTPLKVLAEINEQVSVKKEELVELMTKIDTLGSWYSKEVERLEGIKYIQNEANSLLLTSKHEGKQSTLLELAGSVLPAPSHDGSRESRTVTKLIEALNFQSYKNSCTSGDLSDCVLTYASEVLPRIVDIQRMLRALQTEYYAYLEQLRVNTKTIITLSADNEALRATNISLQESVEALKVQADSDELTKNDLVTEKDTPLHSPSANIKTPVNGLLGQLLPFINDELTKKKALNIDVLEKTISKQTDIQLSHTLKPDLSKMTDDFSMSVDVSITEDSLNQLRELIEANDQTTHGHAASRWEDYELLLTAVQAKHQPKQSITYDIGIASNQPNYKLHYLRSKLDAFMLRHQVLQIFNVLGTLLEENNLQQGSKESFCSSDLSKLIEVLDYKNRRVNELETILLALYQQSTHFFRTYRSVLDMATISLIKQDSLLMHSDMGAISMILLHAKVCLENSGSEAVKDAVLRAFNEQPRSQLAINSRANTFASADFVDTNKGSTNPLTVSQANPESSLQSLLQADTRPSFLLSHYDLVASQSQMPEDTSKHTPLMQAVIEGNYSSITAALITKYACKQDSTGMTALMHAVVHRRFGLISKLAAAEAGMTLPDGRTALFLAIELKYMDIAEELRPYEGVPVARIPVPHREQKHTYIKKGTQSRRDSLGYSNLEANNKGQITGLTNLMAAAEKNDLVTVWILIPNEGCMQDSKGRTALMYAAYAGNLRVAELLLQFEARMQDSNGCTALMYAVQAENVEVVKLLASTEARIINNTFSTALMMAARLKSEQMMNVLAPLECGIQGYSSSATRLLPASLKARRGSINPQNFFTADANGSGVTALMISANVGFKYGVSLLLNEELSLRDRNGYSAYDYAVYGKGDGQLQKEIAHLLRDEVN
ncbi:Protein 21.1 [Giardia lamblia P15]|uniref:Protein 21.1 n=1 Tax=Giardia intestinalis (strain P15) TaxID=658858 RepID=E1F033_GIAIA|nr:Protein 21.1 [Giardia lamblia P15]